MDSLVLYPLSIISKPEKLVKKYIKKILKSGTKFPPGHFHSPLINKAEVLSQKHLFELKTTLPGINLNLAKQKEFLERLRLHYPQIDFPDKEDETGQYRYHFDNPYFSYSDAIIYATLIREVKPQKIVEVGSGYSTACALDTLAAMEHTCPLVCYDPNPERLHQLLREEDKRTVSIQPQQVQTSSIKTEVKEMQNGDILFIDSSHISKAGSDLNYLIHEVLPLVPGGVYVHFHDVFHNFEYPREWIEEGVELNEQYMLRSFLQFNTVFEVVLLSDYMEKHQKSWFEAHMPNCLRPHERHPVTKQLIPNITGQSLWIRRILE